LRLTLRARINAIHRPICYSCFAWLQRQLIWVLILK
jgi:hypothetical protein